MKKFLLIGLTLTMLVQDMKGQSQVTSTDSIEHSVYLIGNTAPVPVKKQHLEKLQAHLKGTREAFTIIHLGDFSEKDSAKTREHISELMALSNGSDMYFIPGDKDWDNSKKNGWKKVKQTEKIIQQLSSNKNVFLPGSGCPGPKVIDLTENLRIVAINSQWFMHPHKKPDGSTNDCKYRTEQEFIDQLNETLQESTGKNLLVVGHHPMVSQGTYGGDVPFKRHFFPFPVSSSFRHVPLPVLGSIYAAYRQNAGTPRDMAHPAYQRYIKGLEHAFMHRQGIVYASAHEYSLQLNEIDDNYQVISGSLTKKEAVGGGKESLFEKGKYGFSKLEYYKDGTVKIRYYKVEEKGIEEIFSRTLYQSVCTNKPALNIPFNTLVTPCHNSENNFADVPFPSHKVSLPASMAYNAGAGKRFFYGKRYRKDWSQPVSMQYLNLDTVKGGLTPYELGGGRQTLSLKLKSTNGDEYVVRSVEKDFTRTLAPKLKNTMFEPILRDVTSTQHPYGALAVSRLLDETDILHARPRLYIIPDHPSLGAFRAKFANMPGMLEEKPDDATKDRKGFMGADKVVQSTTMYQRILEDHSNRVDPESYGKVKVFDMLIGDWGRHQDNLKWASYKRDNAVIYYPIPRDRDHAFSRWDGLISSIADKMWVLAFIEDFEKDFKDVRSLNFNSRHMDRMLLSSLNRHDWKRITAYIQSSITDSEIDSAIASLPPESAAISGKEISDKLKSRRSQLEEAVEDYYKLLAREVDVLGSNMREYFEVERLQNGNVKVRMWGLNETDVTPTGIPLFEREFLPNETKEIRLYGLDGNDIFYVKGESSKSILIRIIGGEGDDKITDESSVNGICKKTIVYDNKETSLVKGKETKDKTSNKQDVNLYDRQAFVYNKALPVAGAFYNSNDGLGLTLGLNYKTHGFRTKEFKAKHLVSITATTKKNFYLDYSSEFRNALGKIDVITQGTAGFYYPSFNFYGFGNNSKKNDRLFENDYYRILNKGLSAGILLQKRFFKNASIKAGPVIEVNQLENEKRVLNTPEIMQEPETITLLGATSVIDLDMRDKKVVATRGVRIFGSYNPYINAETSKSFSVLESFVEYYGTVRLLLPITLAAELGGTKIFGNNIPLYKHAFLGQKHHLRGYVRNRFLGDAAAYLNTELRVSLGKINNPVLPFYLGIFGFKDYGKVWYKGETGDLHGSQGGGIFLAPISSRLTFRLSAEHSEEDLLFDIGAGFYLDK